MWFWNKQYNGYSCPTERVVSLKCFEFVLGWPLGTVAVLQLLLMSSVVEVEVDCLDPTMVRSGCFFKLDVC